MSRLLVCMPMAWHPERSLHVCFLCLHEAHNMKTSQGDMQQNSAPLSNVLRLNLLHFAIIPLRRDLPLNHNGLEQQTC